MVVTVVWCTEHERIIENPVGSCCRVGVLSGVQCPSVPKMLIDPNSSWLMLDSDSTTDALPPALKLMPAGRYVLVPDAS